MICQKYLVNCNRAFIDTDVDKNRQNSVSGNLGIVQSTYATMSRQTFHISVRRLNKLIAN